MDDTLTFARFETFEFEGMDKIPQVLEPLLFYVLHRANLAIYDRALHSLPKLFVFDEDGDLLRSLTRQADVLIMNLRPSTMRKWGLEYETLAAANPKLVMVHVTGYGAGGPKSDWPGFGTLGEAMSGFRKSIGTSLPLGRPSTPYMSAINTM